MRPCTQLFPPGDTDRRSARRAGVSDPLLLICQRVTMGGRKREAPGLPPPGASCDRKPTALGTRRPVAWTFDAERTLRLTTSYAVDSILPMGMADHRPSASNSPVPAGRRR
jgi:hypothetical protein